MKYGGRVFIIKTSNFIESFTEWFSGTRESFRRRPLMLHMGLVGAIIWGKQRMLTLIRACNPVDGHS